MKIQCGKQRQILVVIIYIKVQLTIHKVLIDSSSNLFCKHNKITLFYLKNSTEVRCIKCKGVLTEFKNDVPEARNFDKLIARRLYVFGTVHKLSDETLKKWV